MRTKVILFALLLLVTMVTSSGWWARKQIRHIEGQSYQLGVEIHQLGNKIGTLAYEVRRSVPRDVPHDHWDVRTLMIKWRAEQMAPGEIVLLGDSITEGLWLDSVNGHAVLNAGIGGAGVSFIDDKVSDFLGKSKRSFVVVLVGVNDAHWQKSLNEQYVKRWTSRYSEMVTRIEATGARPILMTILPVEKAGRIIFRV